LPQKQAADDHGGDGNDNGQGLTRTAFYRTSSPAHEFTHHPDGQEGKGHAHKKTVNENRNKTFGMTPSHALDVVHQSIEGDDSESEQWDKQEDPAWVAVPCP